MPQMAPLLWLNLFILFCSTFMIFLILNFFIKVPTQITKLTLPFKINHMNWKW
uniref:ATP synthase complex subunit 8 n=1 Tax=Sicyonia parajaponica TaxID=2486369 RepID=A0A345WJ56_9EUCA|nr:ATP synthase F0 subunit 8 [Sicyonia japonica]AXJ93099.1 ATP synthase F0 subunit 8 [Sicyonia parajaponica]